MLTVDSGRWAVEKSMKLLPSDVHQSHNRPKHHSSDCSKNNMSPDFVLERHQNFIMSEVLSTQFRNKKSFEKKDRFCRHKKNGYAVSQPGGQRQNYLTPIYSFGLFTSVKPLFLLGPKQKDRLHIFTYTGNVNIADKQQQYSKLHCCQMRAYVMQLLVVTMHVEY